LSELTIGQLIKIIIGIFVVVVVVVAVYLFFKEQIIGFFKNFFNGEEIFLGLLK
jgi:hypothetical protein